MKYRTDEYKYRSQYRLAKLFFFSSLRKFQRLLKMLFNICYQVLTEYFYSLDVFRWQLILPCSGWRRDPSSIFPCPLRCWLLFIRDTDTLKYHLKLLLFRQLKWDKINPTQCAHNSEYVLKLSQQNGFINHNFFWIIHTILNAIKFWNIHIFF